jgi:hypothetical protein
MTHDDAMESVKDICRGGRVAYLVDYNQSIAIGLPETFSANDKYYQVTRHIDDARDFPGVVHIE